MSIRILLAVLLCFLSHSFAHLSHSLPARHSRFRRSHSLNSSAHQDLWKRDGTKYIFMHHIVGNTYPYTQLDWEDDFRQMQQNGVDAVALNIGSDSWQLNQLHLAYSAAQSLPTNNNSFRLFLSFDFTAMPCSIDYVVNLVNQFAQHPSQFKVRGRPMVSSYSGDCLGNKGWADVKRRTNGYLMPFIWGLEDKFQEWDSLDSWYCWGCAWPQGNNDKTTNDDDYYFSQLGSRYATTVSVWLYTHYGYKNFLQRSDDWLINSRWEQLIAMRDQLTFVEMVTWNDYGESDYFGPIKGSQPDGTTWANGFPHTAWFEMSKYYITAFKTGQYPPITEDVIYFWARPHPAAAIAVADRLGKPSGHDWTSDYLWAVVFATSTSTITLQSGVSSQTFNNVPAGVTKLKIPLASGKVAVTMFRNGQKVIDHREDNFEFGATPFLYNYNAYVGSAKSAVAGTQAIPSATIVPPFPSSSGASTSTTTPPVPMSATGTLPSGASTRISTAITPVASHTTASLPSSPSSAIPTSPISITIAGTVFNWAYKGCIPDSAQIRVLSDGVHISLTNQTVSNCLTLCSSTGFPYAGIEFGSECWCGRSIATGMDEVAGLFGKENTMCNMPCSGNASETCGGVKKLSLYSRINCSDVQAKPTMTTTTASSISHSTTLPSTSPFGRDYHTFTYYGCVAEGTIGTRRALKEASFHTSDMTPSLCQGLCNGYNYAGVEYGSECYCGNSLAHNGATGNVLPENNCITPCSGDKSLNCGGIWTLSVYTRTLNGTLMRPNSAKWVSAGCLKDSRDRILRGSFTAQAGMTSDRCIDICNSQNYTIAATEYGSQCYCGSQLYKTGDAGTIADTASCNMSCGGDSSQICGGSWHASVFVSNPDLKSLRQRVRRGQRLDSHSWNS